MYSRFIITRSRCNLTTKLSEALRIKTQAVTYKANTFFVQRVPLKAYSVNSMEILQSKNEKILDAHRSIVSSCLHKTETPKDMK